MEGLIKSGAFDCLENNRKFLFDAVSEIIKISKNYKEANLLQDSLSYTIFKRISMSFL